MSLLAAVGWCCATAGGGRPRDFAVATALVVVARVAATSSPSVGSCSESTGRPRAATLALLALVGWLIAVGIAEAAAFADVVRLPWLLLVATLAAVTARRMPSTHQETVMAAVAVLGALLAAIGAGHWLTLVVGADRSMTSTRAEAPLGYPNALGALLLATALLTYRSLPAFGRSGVALLLAQLGVVIATGSRLVLLVGTALACTYLAKGRRRWLRVVAGVWSVAAVAVLAFRSMTVPPERIHLWVAGLRALTADPMTGRGPSPQIIDTGAASVRPTTHVHNEVLQLALEYGLAGVLLGGAALFLAMPLRRARHLRDWPLLLAMTALAALGFTDFALRIPAVALTLAILAGIASGRSEPVGADRSTGRVGRISTRRGPD